VRQNFPYPGALSHPAHSFKEPHRMTTFRRRHALAAAASFIALSSVTIAASAKEKPDATIEIVSHSADVGVGYTWGDGTLTYGAHKYHFKVTGGDVAAVGYSTMKANGVVYDLKHLHDFDGTYGAVSGEATLNKGLSDSLLANTNKVRIRITSATEGARLAGGAQGLTFTLEH